MLYSLKRNIVLWKHSLILLPFAVSASGDWYSLACFVCLFEQCSEEFIPSVLSHLFEPKDYFNRLRLRQNTMQSVQCNAGS